MTGVRGDVGVEAGDAGCDDPCSAGREPDCAAEQFSLDPVGGHDLGGERVDVLGVDEWVVCGHALSMRGVRLFRLQAWLFLAESRDGGWIALGQIRSIPTCIGRELPRNHGDVRLTTQPTFRKNHSPYMKPISNTPEAQFNPSCACAKDRAAHRDAMTTTIEKQQQESVVLEPLLSIDDLAAYTRTPKSTLYSMRSAGGGPVGFRIGKSLRFQRSAVDVWIAGLAASAVAAR